MAIDLMIWALFSLDKKYFYLIEFYLIFVNYWVSLKVGVGLGLREC